MTDKHPGDCPSIEELREMLDIYYREQRFTTVVFCVLLIVSGILAAVLH